MIPLTLDAMEPSHDFILETPPASEMQELGALCSRYIKEARYFAAGLAAISERCDSILAIRRAGKIAGGLAALPLSEAGHEALLGGTLDLVDPAPLHLAPSGTPAAAIYILAIFCPGVAVGNIMGWLKEPSRRKAPLYFRPATRAGHALVERGGAVPLEGRADNLWIYRRVFADQ